MGGFAGCNSFSGTYGTNGNIVRIGALATTRIACDQEVMDQETAFLEALQGVALIETRGQQVNLTDLRGAIKVTLVRPEPLAPASPGPSGEPTEEPTENQRRSRHEEPTADALADTHPDPDADAGSLADTGGISDAGGLPDAAPTGRRDVRAAERRRNDGGHDRVPGRMVHGDRAS